MKNPHLIFNIQTAIFVFFFGIIFSVTALYWQIEFLKEALPTFLALIGIYIVIAIFFEASGFADQWFIYNIADRAIAWETGIDRNGLFQVSSPKFVNQGGDAIAYQSLLMRYRKCEKDNELYDPLRQQLNKIFDNLESTDNRDFLKYAYVYLDTGFDPNNDFKWPTIAGGGQRIQDPTLFWPKSVIAQLHHTISWMTRAQCACLLREEQSFKDFSENKAKRNKLLADFDPLEMFQALVSVIDEDYSLVVRKEALKTYIYWACSDETCKNHFIGDKIYYFDRVSEHWQNNRTEILKNFEVRIGLIK